ncbi:MAG: alpha/beta hydrolase [Cryobacterium sp.]|nr:alpha/beta hydrolase [Oligoflexia bacterium]
MLKLLAWYFTLAMIAGGIVRFFPIFPPYRPLWLLQLLTSELGILFSLILAWILIAYRRSRRLGIAAGMALMITALPMFEMMAQERNWIWDLAYSLRKQQNPDASIPNPYAESSEDALFQFSEFFKLSPKMKPKSEFIATRDQAVLPILIYQPEISTLIKTPARPWIMSIHGGGWDSGEPDQLDGNYAALVEAGYTVISPAYRLAPGYRWPRQGEDVQDAYLWVVKNADRLGLDADRFWVMGRSAGGQLALKFAYGKSRSKGLRGVISLYAPSDIDFGYRWSFEHDILNSRQLLQSYTGATPDVNPKVYRDASPLNDVTKDSPPTLILTGLADPLVWFRHAERLRDALRSEGVGTILLELPWATHGFDFFPNSPSGQITKNAILRFLKATDLKATDLKTPDFKSDQQAKPPR